MVSQSIQILHTVVGALFEQVLAEDCVVSGAGKVVHVLPHSVHERLIARHLLDERDPAVGVVKMLETFKIKGSMQLHLDNNYFTSGSINIHVHV